MAEKPYTKREIDGLFSTLSEKLGGFIERSLVFETDMRGSTARIETKQDHTNGTVAELNEKQIRADERGKVTTRFATGLLIIIFPALGWIFVQFYALSSTLDSRIIKAIDTVL
jgi:hypothetical protein